MTSGNKILCFGIIVFRNSFIKYQHFFKLLYIVISNFSVSVLLVYLGLVSVFFSFLLKTNIQIELSLNCNIKSLAVKQISFMLIY